MRLIKAAGFRQGSAFCVCQRAVEGGGHESLLDVIKKPKKREESTRIYLHVNSWVCAGVCSEGRKLNCIIYKRLKTGIKFNMFVL